MTTFTPPTPEVLNNYFLNYDITAFIAQGGMGAVYIGKQISLDRPVAIKILPPELGTTGQYFQLFQTEAKSLARLNHRNLVGIYDFGEVNGMFYIAMEYVPGRSLYSTVNGLAIEQKEAAYLITEICKGLAHAHDFQILHRDIKPGNILIDDNGHPKLVDFGLAMPINKNTPNGPAMGTPGYSAPELTANPTAVDQRADIYSIGILLYELLTGQLPGTPFIPASRLNGTDDRFDYVIQKATHPMPSMRYASCAEMALDIDSLVANWEASPQVDNRMPVNPLFAASTQSAKSGFITNNQQPHSNGPASRGLVTGSIAVPTTLMVPSGMITTPLSNQMGATTTIYKNSAVGQPLNKQGAKGLKKPSNHNGLVIVLGSVACIICIILVSLFLINYQKEINAERLAAKEAKAEEELRIQEEAQEKKKIEAEEKLKIFLAKKEKEANDLFEANEIARLKEEKIIAEKKAAEIAAAEMAKIKAQEEVEAQIAEMDRIKLEQEIAARTNGPNAVEFSPSEYIKKLRFRASELLVSSKKNLEIELKDNIRELKDLAELEITRLPKGPRKEATKITNDVIADLNKLNLLPSSVPEKANAPIILHYTAALLKQEAIILEHKKNNVDPIFESYIATIKQKIVELKETVNNVEIISLKLELEIVQSQEIFLTLIQ